MPTYAYACTECDHRFEAVQKFTDDALTTCPECEGRLRKVFNSVGVVFKGSGFYRTDSRSTGSASSPAASSTSSSSGTSAEPSSTSAGSPTSTGTGSATSSTSASTSSSASSD